MSGGSGTDLAPANAQRAVDRMSEFAHAAELAELAGGFAHRLNQPLGAIAAFAQAGSRILSQPRPSIEQANGILREISRLALDAGADIRRIRSLYLQDPPAAERCRIVDLVAGIEPSLAQMAACRRGAVACAFETPLPDVSADPARIQYVLLSLVRNAFDAVDPACTSPLVHLCAHRDRDGIVVDVIDSGPERPEARDQELFQPFLVTKVRGMGLNLAASRSIVEAHRGTIGFERLPTGANRFWFRLPTALS